MQAVSVAGSKGPQYTHLPCLPSVTIKTCHWFECYGGSEGYTMAVTLALLTLSSLHLGATESIMDYLRNREDLSQVSAQS